MKRALAGTSLLGLVAGGLSALLTAALSDALVAGRELAPVLGPEAETPASLLVLLYGLFGFGSAVLAEHLSAMEGVILWIPISASGAAALVTDVSLGHLLFGCAQVESVVPKIMGIVLGACFALLGVYKS